jgi:hypothetical protein
MIRVTVEVIPHGDESRKRVIGVADISNCGSPEGEASLIGNYDYQIYQSQPCEPRATLFRSGAVDRFPRKRLCAWDLLYIVLRDAVGHRSGVAS